MTNIKQGKERAIQGDNVFVEEDARELLLTYPFRHFPSIGVMVVELQYQDGYHHRQAYNHHGASKVLGWKVEEQLSTAQQLPFGIENNQCSISGLF